MDALSDEKIRKSVRKYLFVSFSLIAVLTLCVLGYMFVFSNTNVVTPMLTSIVYNLVICSLYIYIWKMVAKYSPDSILQLYLGSTGLRLITAMFVLLIYCYLVTDKPLRMNFALVFCFYYIVMLVFDTLYFVKFERVNRFVK